MPATSDCKASAKRSETGLRKKEKQGGTPVGASAKKGDASVSTAGTAGGLRSSIRRAGNVATSASAAKTDVEEAGASFDGAPAAPSTSSSRRGRKKKKNEEGKRGTETPAAASAATRDVGSAQSLRSSSRIAGLTSLSPAADDPATTTEVAAADADVDATLTNKALRARRRTADAAAPSSSSPFTPISTGKESNKKKRRALSSGTTAATTSNKKSKRDDDYDGAEDDHNDEEDALPTATASASRTTRSRAAAANLTTATTPRLAPSAGNLTISDAQQKHKKTKKKSKALMSSSAVEEFPLASTPTSNTPTSTFSGQKKGKGPAMAADAGPSPANITDASPASDIDSGTTDHVRHAQHTPGAPESWPPAMYRHNDLHKWIIISEAPDFASVRTTYGADEEWPVLPRRASFLDPFGKRELVGGVSSLRSMVECAVQRKDRLIGVVEGLERESVEGQETGEAAEQEREGACAGDESQEKRGYWDVVLRRASVGDVGKVDGPVGREVAIAAARQEDVVMAEASGESDGSGFKSPDAVERVENPGQDPMEVDTRPDSEEEESDEESSILLGTFGGSVSSSLLFRLLLPFSRSYMFCLSLFLRFLHH
ncbi:hypothetical protein MPH_01244 [Macrophomina phaseolina MS6]|uniref:Uncharacterized protein n=1 Tax=Macrophomina phaseolina (strain MS6) TaxID=1126212 RepID=K2RFY6_MACPH|nr:hypothetical protein MPH_01244 [Macrophomina phaseolina MS6]